jgi:hypothetical protein
MPPRPGSRDKKVSVLITGEELTELQRHTWRMSEAFGLDQRIANYKGKRPIGFHSWDLECLLCLDDALNDAREYPDKNQPEYKALEGLVNRLRAEYETNFS